MPAYNKTTWIDGSAPAIDATNLNKMEQGIFDAFRQDGSTTMSGQLVTTAGSVATPAIAPTGDSNTGIFFPSADTIAFGEGGAEAMRITSTGNVGVGDFASNPPPAQFSVSSLTGGVVGVTTKRGSGTNASPISMSYGFYGYLDGEKARITATERSGNTNASDLNFQVKDSSDVLQSRLYISTAGNVGIGTTSPAYKLDVKGTASFEGSSGVDAIRIAGAGGSWFWLDNPTSTTFRISSGSIAGTNPFILTSAGNVGIGTTSPNNYSGRASVAINGTDGGILELMVSGTQKFQIYPESSSITDTIIINASGASGVMRFQIASIEQMRLNNNGYLLIGYTSSNGAYPLQVNGQIFATSSTIATSDGRYKKDVVSLDGALDIVKALNPVQFSWKDHPVHKFNTDVPTVGFIAQEVFQALADKSYLTSIIKKSECTWETETGETVEREVTRDVEKQVTREVEREITETIDGEEVTRTVTEEITETVIEQVTEIVTEPVKETHTEEFLGIAESNLIAILTKAVKELTAKVEALEAQLSK